jgi:hypothetical protein
MKRQKRIIAGFHSFLAQAFIKLNTIFLEFIQHYVSYSSSFSGNLAQPLQTYIT